MGGITRRGKRAKESTGEEWKQAGNKKQGAVRLHGGDLWRRRGRLL